MLQSMESQRVGQDQVIEDRKRKGLSGREGSEVLGENQKAPSGVCRSEARESIYDLSGICLRQQRRKKTDGWVLLTTRAREEGGP